MARQPRAFAFSRDFADLAARGLRCAASDAPAGQARRDYSTMFAAGKPQT